jgi:zinc transporter
MDDFLVYAYLLDGRGGAKHLSHAEVDAWTPDQGLLWLHMDYSAPGTKDWLEQQDYLDDIAVNALTVEDTRPRATSHNGGLLVALRGVNMNPESDPEDMVSIRLWLDENRVISSRKRRLLSVDDILDAFKENEGPESSGDFLAMLCNRLAWRMSNAIDNAEDRVDELEESVLTVARGKLRHELSELRRQAISLRRYLAPQREALSWLQTVRLAWFDDKSKLEVRESADRLSQYIETLDSIRERAAVTQEELINQISEESNARMYLLSLVSALFLPLGFATGLLGINVGGIPGADNDSSFMIFVGILLTITVGILLYFRFKRWV